MSFKIKDKITVLSKSAVETNDDVWYVEINGKYGYAPKKFIVEERVIVSSSKLITVSNVTGAADPSPSSTPLVPAQKVETDSQNAQIVTNSSEADISNVNEVQDKDNTEQLKRSTGEQDLTNNTIEKIVENLDSTKTDEVKIEDLNKYDSKNFEENSAGEEDGDEEEDDEYDDEEDENSPEEESITEKKPVVEEPVVKKTAYVTTDPKGENSNGNGNDDVQPKLEILAPTQAEIEKLKQEQELKSSSQTTNEPNPSANSPADLENAVKPSTIVSSQEPVSSEQQFTTTTAPIDIPQNPLDIPVEVTTPIPNLTENVQSTDAPKLEEVKKEVIPTDSVSENTITTDDSILKNESIPQAEPVAEESSLPKTEDIVLSDEVPPFKPLSASSDSVVNDLHSSTPQRVHQENDQHHHDHQHHHDNHDHDHDHDHHHAVTQEPAPISTSGDNSAVTNESANIIANEQNQPIIKVEEIVTPQPVEVVQEMKIEENNDTLPLSNSEETIESSSNASTSDAENIVDTGVNTSGSNDTAIPENPVAAPVEQIISDNDLPIVDALTQSVKEGVGVVELIDQTSKIEEQQQGDAFNNLNSENIEVESKRGIFDVIVNSVKNLFGGSSTVESLVEEETSPENFDKALNDILFSQAVPPTNDNVNKGMYKVDDFSPVKCYSLRI